MGVKNTNRKKHSATKAYTKILAIKFVIDSNIKTMEDIQGDCHYGENMYASGILEGYRQMRNVVNKTIQELKLEDMEEMV